MELSTNSLFDFKYLINCALDGKITWETLTFLLKDLTPTFPKAKELIKIMLEEFEAFHKKSNENHKIKENNKNESEFELKDASFDENGLELDEYDDSHPENEEEAENESFEEIVTENGLKKERALAETNEIEENAELEDIFEGVKDHEDVPIDMMNKINEETAENLFKCLNCDKEFQSKSALNEHCRKSQHLEDYQNEKDAFKCKSCTRQFKFKSSLKDHTKRVHIDSKLACDYCGEKFYDLKNHMLVHTKETPYECQVCSKRFTKLARLKLHEVVHTNKFRCRFCDKKLESQASLTQHERIHTGEKPFSCTFCEKCFSSSSAKKVHEETHSDEKKYQCKTCDKSFKSRGGFQLHEQYHSTKDPLKCMECDKTFISKIGVERHIKSDSCSSKSVEKRRQSAKEKLKCKPCNKQFRQKSGLKYHQKAHEKIIQMNLNSSHAKPFQCNTCKKSLSSRESYNYHLKTHYSNREISFKCKFCPKSFKSNGGMKYHEESHGKKLKHVEENKIIIEEPENLVET